MSQFQTDLTQGSVFGQLLKFSVPFLLSNLLQALYNMADMVIVGQFGGAVGASAVGIGGQVTILIINLISGLAVGGTIMIAQFIGARRQKEVERTVGTMFTLYAIAGAAITVIMLLINPWVLRLMQTPADCYGEALAYLNICMGGTLFIVGYNAVSAVLRGMGDSRHPLIFVGVAAVVNIVLDLVFIINFHWGCAGAAWATVISQGVSGVLCVIYIAFKLPVLHIRKEEWKLSGEHLKNLSYMGFPMGLQNSITAIGSVILSSAVNTLGSGAVAAMTAAGKVQFIFTAPYDSMGMTLATFAGQNLGARKYSRIDKGMRFGILSMFVYSAVSLVVLYFFGTTVALLFVSASETAILADVHTFLVINAATSFLLALLMIVRYIVQGIGYSNYALFAGLFEMVARTLVALILVPRMGFTGASLANPAAWIAANGFLFPCYFHLMKKIRARNDEVPDVSIE